MLSVSMWPLGTSELRGQIKSPKTKLGAQSLAQACASVPSSLGWDSAGPGGGALRAASELDLGGVPSSRKGRLALAVRAKGPGGESTWPPAPRDRLPQR